MFLKLAVVLVIVQSVLCRPQISFQDGKIGVNFGGYHAEAGLNGLLTGNAADGGLSASAGTPFGQQAGAGIGGGLKAQGRSGGGGFAGASAGGGVGASAAFGGTLDAQTGAGGGVGAESHIPGRQTKVVKLSQAPVNSKAVVEKTYVSDTVQQPLGARGQFETNSGGGDVVITKTISTRTRPHTQQITQHQDDEAEYRPDDNAQPIGYSDNNNVNNNFDYRNFLDFGFFSNTAAGFAGPVIPASGPSTTYTKTYSVPQINKRIEVQQAYAPVEYQKSYGPAPVEYQKSYGPAQTATVTKTIQARNGFYEDIFNIPIATLSAVSSFLNNNAAGGGATIHKSITYG